IARRLGVGVVEVGIQDNHVHIVADLQSWQSPSWVLERLKGESSYALSDYAPNFRKLYRKGHFWSPGKFCRTVEKRQVTHLTIILLSSILIFPTSLFRNYLQRPQHDK
ncbi:transposase, partial [Candidatus Micrarchaeota archaeon]|nr:transposase [Candidatus Micrarchaeota archaeon]